MIAKTDIARLKITLDDVEPVVIRRICVPIGIRLDRLHVVVQAAVGWTGGHLWEFRARVIGWGPKDDHDKLGDGPLDATKATLLAVLDDTSVKTFKYLYDFGDGWEHTIKVERIFDGVPGLDLPFLLEATSRCPPEDIGGPWGYKEFLEAIADPNHERRAEFKEFFGTHFDPNAVDIKSIEESLEAIAQVWRPKAQSNARNAAKPTAPHGGAR